MHQSNWAQSLKAVFKEAMVLNNRSDYDSLSASPPRDQLEWTLQNLLQVQLPDQDKLALSLQKKLRSINPNILCFLPYNKVPPDNNGLEGANRNIKVKRKISGGFRSIEGADSLVLLRSVIDATIKSGRYVYYALSLIAKTGTE